MSEKTFPVPLCSTVEGMQWLYNTATDNFIRGLRDANAELAALRAENERLRADLEQTRVQLAGCGVIAMCNTENSLREQMPAPSAYGYSVSLADVERAVRREIALRAAATEALAVLTRLADSAAYWSDYDVPVGLVAEIDAAKARLAGALSREARP